MSFLHVPTIFDLCFFLETLGNYKHPHYYGYPYGGLPIVQILNNHNGVPYRYDKIIPRLEPLYTF